MEKTDNEIHSPTELLLGIEVIPIVFVGFCRLAIDEVHFADQDYVIIYRLLKIQVRQNNN